MLFEISRVSDYCGEFPPCKRAVCAKEHDGYKDWVIQINTLEDLMELEREVGKLIIHGRGICHGITIYDDYIE